MTTRPGTFSPFRNRNFTILWCAGATASIVRWLEMLAVALFVYQATGSAFQVAIMTILRMAPLAVFGMFSGAIAERGDRRLIMLVGYGLSFVVSLGLGILVITDTVEVWHIALGCLLNGVFWSTDFPARRTLLAETVGIDQVGSSMSLDSITGNGTRMLGPALGGILMALTGLGGAYFFGAALYAIGFIVLLWIQTTPRPPRPAGGKVLSEVADGLRHVRVNRPLMGTLMVTVVFNIWGFPVTAIVPVIGEEILNLSDVSLGLLVSTEGAGALVSALMIAIYGRTRHFRGLYFYGVFLYLNMVLWFASSTNPWLSGALLCVMGLGGAAFAAMQATLAFLQADPEYRSRVMGVVTMCIGTGPLGFAHLGLLADAIGAPLATAVMAVEGIIALLLVVIIWPEVVQP
jgi:MFS family permease